MLLKEKQYVTFLNVLGTVRLSVLTGFIALFELLHQQKCMS